MTDPVIAQHAALMKLVIRTAALEGGLNIQADKKNGGFTAVTKQATAKGKSVTACLQALLKELA